MSLSERVEQLNREIGDTVQRAVADLRREISARLRESHDEILRRLEDVTPTLPGAYLAHEHFAPSLAEAAAEAAAKAAAAAAAEAETRGGTAGRHGAFGELRDALAAIDRGRSQAEILAALLEQTGRFASRSALLLLRGGEVRGWGSHGFGEAEAALRGLSLEVDASQGGGPWERLAGGGGPQRLSGADCGALCSRIDAPPPTGGVLIPMLLRDRVAAALYADSLDGSALQPEPLQLLIYAAALAIETLPFRERPSTATLEPAPPAADGEAAASPAAASAPAWAAPELEPAPAPAAEASPSFVAEPEPALEQYAEYAEYEVEAEPETEALQEAASPWAPAEPPAEPLPELPPETAEPAGEAPVYAVPAFAAELEGDVTAAAEEPAPWGGGWSSTAPIAAEPTYVEPDVMAEPEPEPEPAHALTAELPRVDLGAPPAAHPAPPASDTVLLPRAGLRDAGAAEPAREPVREAVREPAPVTPIRPVPPPPPREAEEAAAAAGSEVRPPTDVQGPGWAFATTRVPVAPSDETLHEEARRLARLLVSEIKLYNEEQVEEGRRNRDLYERLKEDIDRSRQMYEERVDSRILRSTDYFYQELVRILAAGDSRTLGI